MPLRRFLVRLLRAAALTHLLAGVLLTWAGRGPWLSGYLLSVERVFWGHAAPAAAHNQQIWWLALFGATLQSYALYMLGLIHLGDRLRSSAAWAWMIAAIVLWAPQDVVVSLQIGMTLHAVIDGLALLILLPPLIWLYRHDRRYAMKKGSDHD